ncbi:hypothetical protein TEA_028867 [Camellia sinensis var. sinensis]|uniref:C3H1-type domain-containing protein n=1 Tax=Camellia sinensis var. sinensis TaxID=542762 RepID=A0A4S4D811_CAMSN|nr:hypothetical protein TEA_028867 [Camellia sinensis var. sinensis]
MEGSQQLTSLPKPFTHEEHKHSPLQLPDHQLGLGFQPSPLDPDQILDPPPPTDELDQKTADEQLQNPQIVSQELQNQQQPICEELRNQETTDEVLLNQQNVNRELQNQEGINEELQNLVLEEREKVSEKGLDREDDGEGAESKAEEKKGDREVSDDDAEGIDGGNDSGDDDDRSENENQDENGNENVGGETGLVAGSKDRSYRKYNYPLKPDAEDCSYYMRTGLCKFGSNCKFNHPPRMKNQAPKEKIREKEEYPERPGQTECKKGKVSDMWLSDDTDIHLTLLYYYLIICGLEGVSMEKLVDTITVEEKGERECPYYMRNGSCKYESNCRFNHPDPTAVGGGDTPCGYGNDGPVSLQGASQPTISSWSTPRVLNETTVPFVPVMFSPTQGVSSSNLEWNGYQAPVYPTPVRSLPTPPAFLNTPADANFYTHHTQPMLVDEFPERPGQPECSYFLKTGDCKYRSGCKFHHPKNRMPKTAASALTLSDKGLPLRPDQNICSHYNRYGICKFGPACKFDHPVNCGPSDSSALSGPDKPSPSGNSATTYGARMVVGGDNGSEALIQQHV